MLTPNIRQMTPTYLGSSRYDLIIQVFRQHLATDGDSLYELLARASVALAAWTPSNHSDPIQHVRLDLASAGVYKRMVDRGLDFGAHTAVGEEHRNMLAALLMLCYRPTRSLLFHRYSGSLPADLRGKVCDVLNDLTGAAGILPVGPGESRLKTRGPLPLVSEPTSESESEPTSESETSETTETEMSPNISASFSTQTLIVRLKERVETIRQMITAAYTRNVLVIDAEIGTKVLAFLEANRTLSGRVELREPNGNPVIVVVEPTVDHENMIDNDENSLRQLEAMTGPAVELSTGEAAQLLAPPPPVASRKYRVTFVIEPV